VEKKIFIFFWIGLIKGLTSMLQARELTSPFDLLCVTKREFYWPITRRSFRRRRYSAVS